MPAHGERERERVGRGTDCAFDSTWINESTMCASYVKRTMRQRIRNAAVAEEHGAIELSVGLGASTT